MDYGACAKAWVSQRFWFSGESGLAEESGNEVVLSLDAVQLAPHRGGQLG
jgi:hypothetical protein